MESSQKKKRKTAAEKRAAAAAKAATNEVESEAVSEAMNQPAIAKEVVRVMAPKKKRKTAAERRAAKAAKAAEIAETEVNQGPKISGWRELLTKETLTDEELSVIENEYIIPSEILYDPKVELQKSSRRKLAALAFQQRSVQQSLASLGARDVPILDEFFPSPEAILVAADRLSKDAALLRQVKGKLDKTHVQLDRMAKFLTEWHRVVTTEIHKAKTEVGIPEE